MPVNANRMEPAIRPRILLAEDDPVSSAFLAETLRGLDLEVLCAEDGHAALAAARRQRFDALMLDHRLPGVNGDDVLRGLRADPHAASHDAIAIATTAEPDPAIHAGLREAGFARVLIKPFDRPALRAGLRELGVTGARTSPDRNSALDDEAGLRVSGSAQALAALRGLFARELDRLADDWNVLEDDAFALAARLHKLRAACGFCGANALQSAAENLSDSLRRSGPGDADAIRAEFRRALTATREALNAAGNFPTAD